MKKKLLIQFLTSFFLLFKATLENYEIFDKKILGTLGWINEEDKQDFCWEYNEEVEFLLKATSLCDYLNENNFVHGDHIIISENELLFKLISSGWDENEGKKSINYLCSVEIKMLDDGEETDSFFIHF